MINRIKKLPPVALIIIGLLTVSVLAAIVVTGLRSLHIAPTRNANFDIEFTNPTDGDVGLSPHDEFTVNPTIRNISTGPVYAFVSLTYNPTAYDFELSTDSDDYGGKWQLVEDGVYAYVDATSGAMKAIDYQDSIGFNGTLTVTAEGEAFADLTDSDLAIDLDAMGILAEYSRDGVLDAWQDYQDGGRGV